MVHRLGGDVVEVDEVARRVQHGEEEGRARADLVELQRYSLKFTETLKKADGKSGCPVVFLK